MKHKDYLEIQYVKTYLYNAARNRTYKLPEKQGKTGVSYFRMDEQERKQKRQAPIVMIWKSFRLT